MIMFFVVYCIIGGIICVAMDFAKKDEKKKGSTHNYVWLFFGLIFFYMAYESFWYGLKYGYEALT